MRLDDVKLVVVTGAGGGIGRAISQRFAERGATVVATDIDARAAEETAGLIRAAGGSAASRALDVTDTDEFARLAEWVRVEHGVCDVVVNNAGVAIVGEIVNTTEADWDRIMGINLFGVITGAREFARQMVEAGKPGHIVNIASAAAFAPLENIGSYSTTKAAVKMLSDCLRSEFKKHRIGVTAICPGGINTNIARNAPHTGLSEEDSAQRSSVAGAAQDLMSALRVFPGPDSVARAVERAVERDRGTVVMRPEGYFVYALNRISPPLEQRILSLASSSASIDFAYRLARLKPVQKLLAGTGSK